MKKKLWYTLLTVALIVVLAASLSVGALAADPDPDAIPDHSAAVDGGEVPVEGVTAGKYIYLYDDGHYMLDLEAYSTGQVKMKTVPADIILVLDVSGSMSESITSYSYTPRTSQAYSYNSYGNNTYYYKHTDGNYYAVSRHGGNSGNRRLTYQVGNTTWYLSGTGSTNNYTSFNGANTTIYTGVLYTRSSSTQTRLQALQSAVGTFLDTVAQKNQEMIAAGAGDADLSRVAIVKYAMNRFYEYNQDNDGPNTDQIAYAASHTGNHTYFYSNSVPNANYTELVQDLTAVKGGTGGNVGGMKTTVNNFVAGGATAADFGMAIADKVIDNHNNDGYDYVDQDAENYRSRVVVLFTDGVPTYGTDFTGSVANRAVSYAGTLKGDDYGVTVFSVAVNPQASAAEPISGNINQYLHAVSSNFPDATAYNNRGERGDGNYYFVAEDADQLSAIFSEIGSSAAGKALGAETVMTDVMSSAFTLPPNASPDSIHVHVVPWDQTTHAWSTTVSYDIDEWKTKCLEYGAEAAENIEVSVNRETNTVDVNGFDYAKHFKATTAEDDEIGAKQEYNKNTAKLVVTFDIYALPSSVTGGEEMTNAPESGLYLNGEPIINFPQPKVTFTPVTYVVDYVNTDTSTTTDRSVVELDYSGVLADVQMLDDPSDTILSGIRIEDFDFNIYQGKYGTISFGSRMTSDGIVNRIAKYSPTTMNWDDYDRIFIKGKAVHQDPEHPEQELNVWALLAVIPANSVYYEDTFITQTKTVKSYGQHTDIEIKYTGIAYSSQWGTTGTEGDNTTQHAEDIMGWVDVLADDNGYSNGFAHVADTANATATFTFSGTGVDIYSRTDNTTGTILVTLQDAESGGVVGFKIIDNKSAILDSQTTDSGAYYQIPTCTFADLEYGTYTVTIRVTAGAATQGRMTYYLDGVRVYNPIQPLESTDAVVQDATSGYGPTNLGAVFTEVRSLLCNGEAEAAAVFINEHTIEKEVEGSDAIDAAYAALQEAQAALDEWNATNQAVGEAQAAVYAAEDALASAKADLQAAVDARAAVDPEDAEAIAAADEAVANAQAAVTAAEGALPAKQAALDSAYAAQAAYNNTNQDTLLAAVAEANANYQDALDNPPVVPYTEANLADYTKEGPKSEVYLAKGESIAISVEAGKTYYIGLKEITGDGTTVELNGSPLVHKNVTGIQHTTDLYYEATPANGETITIKNTGDGILSITKLRTTGGDGTKSGAKAISTEQLFQAYKALYAAPATDYTGDVLTEDEATTVDPVDVTPADPADPVTEIELGEDDITIEPAEPVIEVVDDEAEPAEEPSAQSAAVSSLAKLLESFFGFFRR